MRIFFKKCKLILIAILAQTTNIYADCDYNVDPIVDPFCDDPDLPVPLDTNLIILIALALIFTFYTLHKKIKHQQVLHNT